MIHLVLSFHPQGIVDFCVLPEVTSLWNALAAAGLLQIVSIMMARSCFLSRAFALVSFRYLVPSSFFHLLGFSGSSYLTWAFLRYDCSSDFIEWPLLTIFDSRFVWASSVMTLQDFSKSCISGCSSRY